MASSQLAEIVQAMRARPQAPDDAIDEQRKGFDLMGTFAPMPEGVQCEALDVDGVPAEWIAPPEADDRAMLYLHGGGYCIGSLESHRPMVANIAVASRTRVLALDYRLAPEQPYPAAVDDATAAYRWLLANGCDPVRTAVVGDSAGGGLTAATLLSLRDGGSPLPAAAVCMSPWFDLTCESESMRTKADDDPVLTPPRLRFWSEKYRNGADPRDPIVSPLYADLAGLPPLLVQVGTAEVLLDDATQFAERARAAGVEITFEPWDEMIHIWQIFFMLPEAQQAIDRVGSWVRERVPVG